MTHVLGIIMSTSVDGIHKKNCKTLCGGMKLFNGICWELFEKNQGKMQEHVFFITIGLGSFGYFGKLRRGWGSGFRYA